MNQMICVLPVAPLRGEPSHRSEMVSQLLFGERVVILGQNNSWLLIRSLIDQYEGWLDERCLASFDNQIEEPAPCLIPKLFVRVEQADSGWVIQVPGGSFFPLSALKGTPFRWGNQGFRLMDEPSAPSPDIFSAACLYLGAPYLWGGKTIMGVDCSGLVQVAGRLVGISLPRDARQQGEIGREIAFERRQFGDLAFFQNERGQVVHVGIVGPESILVHASGNVRLDILSGEGIFCQDTQRVTHRLAFIKRLI